MQRYWPKSRDLFHYHIRCLNTLRPRQNGRHFADDIFKCIFLNENVRISIKISLKFVPKGPINNSTALVQIMAWRRPGDKPLSEPMLVSLLTHICVTRPQWVNPRFCKSPKHMNFDFKMLLTFGWGLAAMLGRHEPNFKLENYTPVSCLWDFARSYERASYLILKWPPVVIILMCHIVIFLVPLLLIWINFNPSMDK